MKKSKIPLPQGRVIEISKTKIKMFCGIKSKGTSVVPILIWVTKAQWAQCIDSEPKLGDIAYSTFNGWKLQSSELPAKASFHDDIFDSTAQIQIQKQWAEFLRLVRTFFQSKNFFEIETPTLVNNPGPEPTLDVFSTIYREGKKESKKYLITSPELNLKKVISKTLSPVYQIARVFRNNEVSNHHEPEFTMIEWYRPFATLQDIKQDVISLIEFLASRLKIKIKSPKVADTSFAQSLKKNYDFEFGPKTTANELFEFCRRNQQPASPDWSIDDLFTLVNLEFVESRMNPKAITFLNKYPPYAAALAEIDNQGWAQRFEVYWKNLELGNAFQELTDVNEQKERLNSDNQKKQKNGLEILPDDHEFLNALSYGLPPTAGIALGLERLFMCLYGYDCIQKTKWFAHSRSLE